MVRTSICVACDAYGSTQAELAVDPACRSEDEADALCRVHRARMTEGYCVLCARRAPWTSPWPGSRIGACEACHAGLFSAGAEGAITPRAGMARAV